MDIVKSFTPASNLVEHQKCNIDNLTEEFVSLALLINESCVDSREKSLALTKLQEAKMWTIECIAKN